MMLSFFLSAWVAISARLPDRYTLRYFWATRWDILHRLFWRTDPLPVEMASGLTALFWGLLLWLFQNPFEREIYRYFNLLAPSKIWAALFLFFGLSQLLRILHCSREKWIHQSISGFAAFTWIYVATALYAARPDSTVASVYVVLAIGSLWAFIRSGRSGSS